MAAVTDSTHPSYLRAAAVSQGLDAAAAEVAVEHVASSTAAGQCPRCAALLGRHPARSRITEDRCISICSECGQHEAAWLVTGAPEETIANWPLDASQVRAQSKTIINHGIDYR